MHVVKNWKLKKKKKRAWKVLVVIKLSVWKYIEILGSQENRNWFWSIDKLLLNPYDVL